MVQKRSVVCFLIDGMRPDGLQQADTPNMKNLVSEGAHTLTARTVVPSITLPCHVSLFFGVKPEAHGIFTNDWQPLKAPVPGLFDVIARSGLHAAAFYNWENLRDLSRPGSLKASFFLKDNEKPDGATDQGLASLASDYLSAAAVDFAFIYFHQTDSAGHRDGYMSQPYLKAIANADRCIGKILQVLSEDAVVIVTADHGGKDFSHGTDSREDTTVPFIIKGPGIPKGHVITRQVDITDIAPTITDTLCLDTPAEWIGEAISFEQEAGIGKKL